MTDATTPVNASPGAWFVYEYDPERDAVERPMGVFAPEDELAALRLANYSNRFCIWWPYGLKFGEADAAHWNREP